MKSKKRGIMNSYLSAINVAKYLLYKANFDGESITNLKMQKLLYYAQAWYLVNHSKPLFKDDIKAWKYGPIIEEAYHHFKRFRYSPISFLNSEKIENKIPAKEKIYLDEFYKTFIRFSASDLTQASHNDDPWKNTKQGETISIGSMMIFYKNLLKKHLEQEKAQKS